MPHTRQNLSARGHFLTKFEFYCMHYNVKCTSFITITKSDDNTDSCYEATMCNVLTVLGIA